MIAIIDLGLGNTFSLYNSLFRISKNIKIINNNLSYDKHKKDISHIILPGVGSFQQGMSSIVKNNLYEVIVNHAKSQKPILGICLGMQLLFNYGEEGGQLDKGLNLIDGIVKKLKKKNNHKIPHVGWNDLNIENDHILLEGFNPEVDFYFVHSYVCIPKNEKNILSKTKYSENFVSVICEKNIFGVQFHPEKSSEAGIKILKNFINWDGK